MAQQNRMMLVVAATLAAAGLCAAVATDGETLPGQGVACHDGSGKKAPAAMDLRGTRGQLPPSDDQSKRKYSTAYLSLSYKGHCN